jgi:hypothetical protein
MPRWCIGNVLGTLGPMCHGAQAFALPDWAGYVVHGGYYPRSLKGPHKHLSVSPELNSTCPVLTVTIHPSHGSSRYARVENPLQISHFTLTIIEGLGALRRKRNRQGGESLVFVVFLVSKMHRKSVAWLHKPPGLGQAQSFLLTEKECL